MDETKRVKKVLLKKALGYEADEVVVEYGYDENGEPKISKKKVTTKHYAPDLAAIKVLLDKFYDDLTSSVYNMTDEQLEKEKMRLIALLKEDKDEN